MDEQPTSGAGAKRALVVDDSRSSRRLVAAELEALGVEVTQAESGEEAFAACLERPFHLIVSDLEMGGLSGVQLCRIVRSDPEWRDTPFLLLTSRDDPRSRFWSRQAGADGHLAKSRMREELAVVAEPLLQRRRPPQKGGHRPRATNPLGRLTEVLERSLFEAVITSEARRLFELLGDRATLGRAVLDLACELTRAEAASLELPGGGEPTHLVRVPAGLDAASERALLELASSRPDSLVLREPNVRATPGALSPFDVPLSIAGSRHGTLRLLCHGEVSAEDAATAELLAEAIAPALGQLRLLEETRRLATTDELTGVKNRREIQRRLGHEVARAARYGVALSLAMIDVDHFKRVNDDHGHSAGDAVLREVAAALRGGVRQVDLAGRWGGEEFLLVLGDTPLSGARLLADRLRRRVRVATTAADLPCHVTVSIGVAEFEPGLSPEALVDRADRALYRAKEGGRDRVVTYTAEAFEVALAAG